MYYMVILVIDDPDQCNNVLDVWEEAGVRGITILESTGLARMKKAQQRDDFPIILTMTRLLAVREERHRTIFTVVEGEDMVDKLARATQEVIGDLSQPHTGFMFSLPVGKVFGLGEED